MRVGAYVAHLQLAFISITPLSAAVSRPSNPCHSLLIRVFVTCSATPLL